MNKRIYIGFLMSYFLVFLIPVILNIITQRTFIDTLVKNVSESRLQTLEQARDIMDSRLTDIDNMISTVSNNLTIRALAYKESPKVNTSVIPNTLRAKQVLDENKFPSLIENYYLYFRNPKIFLSPYNIFLSIEEFYGSYFTYNDMDQGLWANSFLEQNFNKKFFPSTKYRIKDKVSECILYVQSFPIDTRNLGTFFIPIETEDIHKLLANDTEGGYSYIIDQDGNVLTSTSMDENGFLDVSQKKLSYVDGYTETKIDNKKIYIVHARSKYNGLQYVTVIPEKYITMQLSDVKSKLLYMMLIEIFAGVLFISILAYFRSKPISDTIKLIENSTIAPEQYVVTNMGYITKSVAKLIDNNNTLKKSINRQRPLMKMLLVEKLLKGSFYIGDSAETIEYSLLNLNMEPKRGPMCILIARIDIPEEHIPFIEMDELVILKQIVKTEVIETFHCDDYFYDIDLYKSAFVIELDDGMNRRDLEVVLDTLCQGKLKKLNVRTSFFLGNVYTEYMHLSDSYTEAIEMLNYKPLFTDKQVWFYDESFGKDNFYYPINIEERLINTVKLGDKDLTEEQLRRIYKENIMNRDLNPVMLEHLVYELKGSLLKIINSLPGVDFDKEAILKELYDLKKTGNCLEEFQKVTCIYMKICIIIQDSKQSKTTCTIENVVQFIDEHYMDPALSLSSIADQFNFASSYLSFLFKNEYGENFSIYLQKKRIHHACELLVKGKTLQYIAEHVGYNSVHVLRNAFKRTMGMNPNEYRSQNRKGN